MSLIFQVPQNEIAADLHKAHGPDGVNQLLSRTYRDSDVIPRVAVPAVAVLLFEEHVEGAGEVAGVDCAAFLRADLADADAAPIAWPGKTRFRWPRRALARMAARGRTQLPENPPC